MFYKKIFKFIYSKYGFFGLKDFVIKSFTIRLNTYLKNILNIFKCTYSRDIHNLNKTNKIFDYDKVEKIEKNNFNTILFQNLTILGIKITDFFHLGKHESWIKKNINFSNKAYCLNIYRKLFKKFEINPKSKIKFMKWNYDPKNNYHWPAKQNSLFIKIDFNKKRDVKYPWEISRLQHLTVLALKIRKFSNQNKKKSYLVLKNQIFDFIISNPPGFGINWKSTMEVAIRGANLSVLSDILETESSIEKNEKNIILNCIQDHLYFVKDNLEWSYLNTSNHYLANIVGLIVMTYHLPRTCLNKQILSFSSNQLINEIDNQFFSDGGNKEGSTAYHIFSNEIILIGLYFYLKLSKCEKRVEYSSLCSFSNKLSNIIKYSKKINENFENKIFKKLQKINYFSSKCIRNNKTLLQIGDNDSGCFFPFDYSEFFGEKKHLHKNLSNLNETNPFFCFMNKKTVQIKRNTLIKNHLYKSNLNNFDKMFYDSPKLNKKQFFIKFKKKIDIKKIELDIFDNFGLYCFKSKEISLFIICKKKINFFNSGHNHDDNLSIDLVVNNETIITDPGSFCYTDNLKLRYLYRGLNAHFTPRSYKMLNQEITKNPFYFQDYLDGKCEYIDERIFVGSVRMRNIIIYRFLEIKNNGILIKDFCKNDRLVEYPSLNQNIKISTSYGKLSKFNMINKKKIGY